MHNVHFTLVHTRDLPPLVIQILVEALNVVDWEQKRNVLTMAVKLSTGSYCTLLGSVQNLCHIINLFAELVMFCSQNLT
jgi:hypothetical protein